MPKTTVRGPPRTNGWTLAHCPPSSEWGPGGNTGEIKAARKGTGHPTSKADGSGQVSSLTGTPQRTDRIWDLPFYQGAVAIHLQALVFGAGIAFTFFGCKMGYIMFRKIHILSNPEEMLKCRLFLKGVLMEGDLFR